MNHRIYIDLQAAQSVAHAERGIARYTIELTRAMLRHGAPIDAVALNPHLPNPRGLPLDLAKSPLLTWRTASTIAHVAQRGPLAYHVMSPIELELSPARTIPPVAIERADAVVCVLYDLIPLVFRERYLMAARVRDPYLARLDLLRNADLLLAISEHTRRDAIEHLGVPAERVVTIGGGVPDTFRPPTEGEDPNAIVRSRVLAIERPYVLTVAGWEWRKNTENLIRAFASTPADVRRDTQLVIACAVAPEGEAAWRHEARAVGLTPDQLVITGYVDDEMLRALYQAAALFVFPSRYEGFGLPVAEAARCGAPVITSSASSLPEILELPSSTFSPDDVEAMAGSIARGLTDSTFRATLRDAGARAAQRHTWDEVGRRTVQAYERLGARESHRARRRVKTRVAFVGPLPPTESGVAVYNERVLASLGRAGDLDLHVFVDGDTSARARSLDVPTYPIGALDELVDPYDYDAVLYTIGNSRFHVRSFDLAKRHPGIVWLHDAYLIGLHLEWALWQIRSGRRATDVLTIFREEILRLYHGRIPAETVLLEPLSHHAFVDRGVYLSADLVRDARYLICNSQLALDMARRDLGPDGVLPPSTVLHHAVPGRDVLPIPAAASPRTRPLVVALGIVHAIKRPDVLIHAVASLGPDVDLAFVGPCDDEARVVVDKALHATGLASRVTITGFVSVDDYARWIREASIVVQLRDVSFGESSGPVHDAIAAAVPVVTSIASCAGLPDGLVRLVSQDATAAELASAIGDLVRDERGAPARRAAAAAFAAEWTFDRVADEVAAVIRAVATPPKSARQSGSQADFGADFGVGGRSATTSI